MTERPSEMKWKDHLLKSSLPLEQLVAEKLEQHDFTVLGAYAYLKANENDRETEFSVDIRAASGLARQDPRTFSRTRAWGTLNVLAECKYATPGVNWVFSRVPNKPSQPSPNWITCLDTICTERVTNQTDLNTLAASMHVVTRGIALHGSSPDSNTITRGLSQLRYALPNLVSQLCYFHLHPFVENVTHMSFICPMVVTTAQLCVLKAGLGSLSAYEKANTLEDVVDLADAVIAHQEPGLQYYQYSSRIAEQFVQSYPEVTPLLQQIDEALEQNPDPTDIPFTVTAISSSARLAYPFSNAGSSILIVRYDALDDILRAIVRSVLATYHSARTIARAEIDGGRISRFVPAAGSEALSEGE